MCEFNGFEELDDQELEQVSGGGPVSGVEPPQITPDHWRCEPVRASKYPPDPAR
jgi:bacteriocin-like protein